MRTPLAAFYSSMVIFYVSIAVFYTEPATAQQSRLISTIANKDKWTNLRINSIPISNSMRQQSRFMQEWQDQWFLHRSVRRKRASTSRKEKLWTDGVIPYEIDANYSGAHKSLFKQAMRHWENYTCISFVERNPEEHPNYILFIEKPCGCCSYVGMKGTGSQVISIGRNCDKFGNVVHELGHVVGFWHEHTRPDRNNYIKINHENIISGQQYNFDIMNATEINSLDTKYDYTSVMHYSTKTFSKNPYLDTISVPSELPEDVKQQIGQRLRLSAIDILQANLLYNCPACGRTFQGNSANFSSTSFLDAKSAKTQFCVWRIQGTHGDKIVLNITELDIPLSPNCSTDYLEILDGYWKKSKVLRKLCGKQKYSDPVVSSGSRLLVTYYSENPIGHRGFAANYEAVCGGVLYVENQGKLESPNYPMDYRANTKCIWKLYVPENFQVALKFNSFQIEGHDKCYYDYVEVRDGVHHDSPLIGTFCGQNLPPDVKSSSNSMWVKFSSDSSVGNSGFSATFLKEYDECKHLNHGCQHECVNTLGSYKCACKIGYELNPDGKSCDISCGGILESLNGTFTSPSYPDSYPINKQCIWEIRAPPGYLITLNFSHFDLDDFDYIQEECVMDKIDVYSKIDKEKLEHHGTFCGTNPPVSLASKSNVMRIVFLSDYQGYATGFMGNYFTYVDWCGAENNGCEHYCNNDHGNHYCSCKTGYILDANGKNCLKKCVYDLQGHEGQIESPGYPALVEGPLNCGYHHITKPGHRISVTFNDFDLDDHAECMLDFVQFHNGNSIKNLTLSQKYCGSDLPNDVHTYGNELFMIFESTYGGYKGFQATYSTLCGGVLKASEEKKYIYSHVLYGQAKYNNDINCYWKIEPPLDFNVRIEFISIDLEPSLHCNFDYVEVLDDLEYSEISLGKFCGNNLPGIVESNEGPVKVVFKTDSDNKFNGFLMTYQAVEPLYKNSEEVY